MKYDLIVFALPNVWHVENYLKKKICVLIEDKCIPHCFPKEYQGCYEHWRDLEPTWKRKKKEDTAGVI